MNECGMLSYTKCDFLSSLLECFRSDQLVDYNGTFYNAFRCIQWTKITDNSYMYYPMTGKIKQN